MGQTRVWGLLVPGITLWPPCGLSCVCLAQPLSPGHFGALCSQRAGHISSRGKYRRISRTANSLEFICCKKSCSVSHWWRANVLLWKFFCQMPWRRHRGRGGEKGHWGTADSRDAGGSFPGLCCHLMVSPQPRARRGTGPCHQLLPFPFLFVKQGLTDYLWDSRQWAPVRWSFLYSVPRCKTT